MVQNLFSVPIFFIVFRETLEAAIIVSVLLGLAEQIVNNDGIAITQPASTAETTQVRTDDLSDNKDPSSQSVSEVSEDAVQRRRLVRKLRFQIFLGGALGLFISLAIGASFLAVWFTKASSLWDKSEELWEGTFELVASIMIFVMGITMLKMDRAKAKWRVKLQRAFDGKRVSGRVKTGKWALFILPFITILREGLEAVVFVGGVSLGQPATSIPIAAIVGIVCGLVCGFLIYEFASRSTLTVFLVVMTNFLLLIGAGLFSKAVWAYQQYAYNKLLGVSVDDALGDGPGSYRVQGNVWHVNCCNPQNRIDGQGWLIFAAIFGWTNSATLGSVLAYVFYWILVIVVLVYMKFKEGRVTLAGRESAAGVRRRRMREIRALERGEEPEAKASAVDVGAVDTLPR